MPKCFAPTAARFAAFLVHCAHHVNMIGKSLARQFQALQDGEKKTQTYMIDIDLDVSKVSALKNDSMKEIKSCSPSN